MGLELGLRWHRRPDRDSGSRRRLVLWFGRPVRFGYDEPRQPGSRWPSATTQLDGTWAWTWTFDLCGAERTVSTTTASGTRSPGTGTGPGPGRARQQKIRVEVDIGPVTADTTSQAAPSIGDASVPSNVIATSEATAPTAGEPTETVDPVNTFSSALQLVRSLVSVRFGGLVPRAATALAVGFEATSPALTFPELGPTDGTAIVMAVPGLATGPVIVVQTPPATLPATFTDLSPAAGEAIGSSSAFQRADFEHAAGARARVRRSGLARYHPSPTPEARPAPAPRTSSTGARQRHDSGLLFLDFEGWLRLAGATTGGATPSVSLTSALQP
jgi:hypothetical protein